MFSPLSYRDTVLIGRGLLVLIVGIAVGISVTQQQLNSLTHWQERIQIFNMNRDNNGHYSLAVFGYGYSLSAIIPVAEIANEDKSIAIKTSICTMHIPKTMQVDCRKELNWLTLQIRWIEKSIMESWQKINVYILQFR